jgi:putative peptidoglycan lipid II flippase
MAVNLALNLVLMVPLRHVGMALATSAAGWVNVGMMLVVLRRRGWYVAGPGLLRQIAAIIAACAAMVASLLLLTPYVRPYFLQGEAPRFAALSVLVITGAGGYFLSALLLNIMGCRRQLLQRLGRKAP